eukprot:5180434-Pyramimonas_sp.AAC.1
MPGAPVNNLVRKHGAGRWRMASKTAPLGTLSEGFCPVTSPLTSVSTSITSNSSGSSPGVPPAGGEANRSYSR